MLAKYIDKYNIQYANYNRILEYNNKQVINPTNDDFVKAGYRELILNEQPLYDMQTQYLEENYIQQSDIINQVWIVHEILQEEENINAGT